jgi:hypothetical protein
MANLPEPIKNTALERMEGQRPNRFRAAGAAILAGLAMAVAFYRWLRT